MRPVYESRSSDSRAESWIAMRSMRERRVGAERRMESRMWVPTGDWVRIEIASAAVRRLLRSLRRNVRFEGCGGDEEKEFDIGFRETWMMCDVLVQSASVSRVFEGSARSPSWISEFAPGMRSIACARKEPWSCWGVAFGAGFGGGMAPSDSEVRSITGGEGRSCVER